MAPSSSSTSARERRRITHLRQTSREDRYEDPLRHCYHNIVAPRWTSWTEENPGRRFYGCRFYYDQRLKCGFFDWHDNKFGDRENNVILELLDDIDHLYDENMMLQRRIREVERGQGFAEEIEQIYVDLKMLKRKQRANVAETNLWKMKYKRMKAAMFCSWVMFVVFVFVVIVMVV